MNFTVNFLLTSAITLTHLQSVSGIINIDLEKKQKIDDFINSLLFNCESNHFAGANLAIVFDGKIQYTAGYGVRNLETRDNVTEMSLFTIASITKHMATTLLGQIFKETDYGWTTPIRDILGPDFYFYDPLRTTLTTSLDLAAHRMGMLRNDGLRYQGITREELADKIRFVAASEPLRTDYIYNNLMYFLLGHVTETVGGDTWERLVQNRLFEPTGMVDSVLVYEADLQNVELVTPYMLDGSQLREVNMDMHIAKNAYLGTSAGIMSTANDMARWMLMLLNGGTIDGVRVVDSDVIIDTWLQWNVDHHNDDDDDIQRPRTPVTYFNGNIGLGWRLGDYRGYRMKVHSGSMEGHYTQYNLLPDVGLGVYTSTSGQETRAQDVRELIVIYIMDVMLGFEPWLNASTACTFPEPFFPQSKVEPPTKVRNYQYTSTKDKIGIESKRQYEGTFGNFAYGNITVYVEPDTEDLVLSYGQIVETSYVLLPTSDPPAIEYIGLGLEPNWMLTLEPVVFEASDPSLHMDITFRSSEGPIRFERNLGMSDAPAPGFDFC